MALGKHCFLVMLPSSLTVNRERMTFPLWKSLHSLNLMLPKEDRKALLLRLFNDNTPLINQTHKQAQKQNRNVELKVETWSPVRDGNSSSPEGGADEPDVTKDSTATLYS